MNEKMSASLLDTNVSSNSQRKDTRTIANSKPRPFADVDAIQSLPAHSALPHPSPHRTLSGPSVLQTSSIQGILENDSGSPSSRNTSKPEKNLRFAKDDILKKSKTTPLANNPTREGVNRRHSADPKMNVHTKCGRNSDDWLFGGWNVGDTVKKLWEKEPKVVSPQERKI